MHIRQQLMQMHLSFALDIAARNLHCQGHLHDTHSVECFKSNSFVNYLLEGICVLGMGSEDFMTEPISP